MEDQKDVFHKSKNRLLFKSLLIIPQSYFMSQCRKEAIKEIRKEKATKASMPSKVKPGMSIHLVESPA